MTKDFSDLATMTIMSAMNVGNEPIIPSKNDIFAISFMAFNDIRVQIDFFCRTRQKK